MFSNLFKIGLTSFLCIAFSLQAIKAQLRVLSPQYDLSCLSSTFSDYESKVQGLYLEQEGERVLKLVLKYQGFEDAYLWVEVLDQGRKPVRKIPLQKAHLQGLRSPLGITLSAPSERDEVLESQYVRVSFGKTPQKAGNQLICYTYRLEKKWGANPQREISPIVKAEYRPAGTAATLEKGYLPKPEKKMILVDESESLPYQTIADTIAMDSLDRKPYGPGNRKVSLWQDIYQDAMLAYEDILPIDFYLYEDENPASLTYYYVPKRFTLRWEVEKGYHLLTAYGGTDSDHQATVRVHAMLDAGIRSQEVEVIESLLGVYTLRRYGNREAKLLPLPLRHQPDVRLSELEMYGTQNVSVQAYTQLDNPISIAWKTDTCNLDEMMVLFSEGMGINGSMTLVPDADSVPSLSVPVYINFADPGSLGQLNLDTSNWRNEYLVNNFPFPIRLGQLHLLFTDYGEETRMPQAYVYSFDSDTPRIPMGGRVYLDLKSLPHWIDKAENLEKVWIDYEVEPCNSCFRNIRNAVTNGTSASTERMLTFEVLDMIVESGAKKMTIDTRSLQASSSGRQLGYLPAIHADRDGIYQTGPLFVPSEQLPVFEYRITLIMKDGQKRAAVHWERSTSTEVYLSSHQLKTLFPDLKSYR
jgi:hypothetical protein